MAMFAVVDLITVSTHVLVERVPKLDNFVNKVLDELLSRIMTAHATRSMITGFSWMLEALLSADVFVVHLSEEVLGVVIP